MQFSPYCIRLDDPSAADRVVLFSTRTGALLLVARAVLRDAEQGRLSDDEEKSLTGLGLLVPGAEEEKRDMCGYIDEMNLLSTSLRPVVVLNLDCNLACGYCFEGTRKGKYFISEQTANDFVRFIASRMPGKKEILPTFYGGEPLLSIEMIERISADLGRLAEQHGARYGFRLITNGTLLTRRNAERLKQFGLKAASVTLDGPADVHDRARPFRSGAGSFDTILSNLKDCCGLIELHVGGNYTSENYRAFPRLLDHLLASGLGPDRLASVEFSPVVQESSEFMPDFHGGCANMNEPWIAEAGIVLRGEILNRGFQTASLEPSVCMIDRHDHFVVNWNGDLYKCPGLLGRQDARVGTLVTGMSGTTAYPDAGNWKNETCLSCSYLPLCFGGCRYLRLIRQGTMQGVECKRDFYDRVVPGLVLQDLARIGAAGI